MLNTTTTTTQKPHSSHAHTSSSKLPVIGMPGTNTDRSSAIANIRTIADVASEYSIRDVLGNGSQGVVYRATCKKTNKIVAIKSISHNKNGQMPKAAEREVNSLSKCNHPCIMSILDSFVWNGRTNIVMELLPVDALRLLRRGLDSHKWTTSVAFRILYCLISGVKYLHENLICHLDIKLENILVDGDGAKLCDFGLAEQLQFESQQLCVGRGSVHYTAPEVLGGHAYDGRRADMWSVGVVAYGLLIGRLPFLSKTTANLHRKILDCSFTLPDNLHPDLKDFLSKLIALNAYDRLTAKEAMQHRFWLKACEQLGFDPKGITASGSYSFDR